MRPSGLTIFLSFPGFVPSTKPVAKLFRTGLLRRKNPTVLSLQHFHSRSQVRPRIAISRRLRHSICNCEPGQVGDQPSGREPHETLHWERIRARTARGIRASPTGMEGRGLAATPFRLFPYAALTSTGIFLAACAFCNATSSIPLCRTAVTLFGSISAGISTQRATCL